MSNGVGAGGESQPPLSRAERNVAEYFRDEAADEAAGESSKGFLSSLMSWFSPEEGSHAAVGPGRGRAGRACCWWTTSRTGWRHWCGCSRNAGTGAGGDFGGGGDGGDPGGAAGGGALDIMMPGTDGIALLKAIRADPANAKLPVLMLTANHRRMLESFTSGRKITCSSRWISRG